MGGRRRVRMGRRPTPRPRAQPLPVGRISRHQRRRRGQGESAPLARAQQGRGASGRRGRRVSPARAGSTHKPHTWVSARSSQPRSRGLNRTHSSVAASEAESAPLARAQPACGKDPHQCGRVNPARAGSTRVRYWPGLRATSQPRSRGLHPCSGTGLLSSVGPLPLARAQLAIESPEIRSCRVIPARAGCTRSASCPCTASTSHSRSRGRYVSVWWAASSRRESAPLARAQPRTGHRRDRHDRVSPARAGSTLSGLGVLKCFANLLLALATRMMPHGLNVRLSSPPFPRS